MMNTQNLIVSILKNRMFEIFNGVGTQDFPMDKRRIENHK